MQSDNYLARRSFITVKVCHWIHEISFSPIPTLSIFGGTVLKTLAKWTAYLFIAFVLFHWLTAGQDEIIEGPPETPDHSLYQHGQQ